MDELEEKKDSAAEDLEPGFDPAPSVSDIEGKDFDVTDSESVADEPEVPVDVVLPEEPGIYEYDKEAVDSLISVFSVPLLKEVFLSRATAVDAISFVGRTVFVSYRAEAEPSEDMKKLSAKIADVRNQMERFLKEKSVLSFQAKTIGCKKCGSQLAKEYLKDDCCPLCGNDLRAPSTIAGEADYRQRIASMESELDDMGMLNQVRNGKVCYLLRVL